MDKKCFTTVIVSGILIHLVIIAFYVTTHKPITKFVADKKSTRLDVSRKRNDFRTENKTPSHWDMDPDSSNERGAPSVLRQLENSDEVKYDFPVIYKAVKTLNDENHPQFHPAFARHIKPLYLIDWVPSPESKIYFQPIRRVEATLYSAFFLDCSPPSVKLFGISYRSKANLGVLFCHFYDVHEKLIETQKGSMRGLKDNHSLNYTAATVDCPITPGKQSYRVSVTKENDPSEATNRLTIQYPGGQLRNFSVCFSPLHSEYNATLQLVQSIEINILLGASHFYFYNFSISPQTEQILRHYEMEGLATILPWPLPHLETWYYGQVMAINDCIYRNRMTSRYVAVVDTDEFIFPSRHSNWLDLINDVTLSQSLRESPLDVRDNGGHKDCPVLYTDKRKKSNSPAFGSYMFKNSYFTEKPLTKDEKEMIRENNLELSDEQEEFFNVFRLRLVHDLKRNDFFYDHGKRSKLIVRPETVVSHGIHKTVEHIAGFQTAYVDSKAAYLHHYRPDKIKLSNTFDFSALKFKDEIYTRLKKAIKKFPSLFPVENLDDFS